MIELVTSPFLRMERNDVSEAGCINENSPRMEQSATYANPMSYGFPGDGIRSNGSISIARDLNVTVIGTASPAAQSIFGALTEGIQPMSITRRGLLTRRAQLHAARKVRAPSTGASHS